jgi:hypothetical protein
MGFSRGTFSTLDSAPIGQDDLVGLGKSYKVDWKTVFLLCNSARVCHGERSRTMTEGGRGHPPTTLRMTVL